MRADRRRQLATLAFVGVFAAAASARSQSTPQEKKRGDILRELGLQKKPAPPAAPATAPDAGGETPGEAGSAAPVPEAESKAKSGAGRATSVPAAGPSFRRAVHPLFVATCKACHTPGAAAGATRLVLSGDDLGADHRAIVRLVDLRHPEASAVLAKAAGAAPHGGGAPWPAGSAPYERVLAWVRAGARLDGAAAPPATASAEAPKTIPPRGTTPRRPSSSEPTASVGGAEPTPMPPAPLAVPAPAPAAPVAAPAPPPPPEPAKAAPVPLAAPAFATGAHPVLMAACALCHRQGGPAAATRLVLSGDAGRDEATARALVDPQAPEQSPLVVKASGQMHGGGAVLPAGDPRLETLLAWTRGLAPPAPEPAPATAPNPSGAPLVVSAPLPPPPLGPQHGGPGGHPGMGAPGLALPFGFMLDGRFSLDYERRQFSGNPFAEGSVNALRSYHHFLFLSRDAAGDPCGLSVEILTLQFWEAHCRLVGLPAPLRVTVAGGKIVVPFGADPLYHQSYGGLGGFDQPILPVIWAVEGAAAHLVADRGPFVITDDLFVVRGFALPRADAVINLQSDFSALDATRLGWGNRFGVAWMFASAWYSAYLNPLGFGRRLFMQAVDLTIWRPRGVPVLGHFSLGAGLLRADVSGGGAGVGGPGLDYYDFGSYLQLRYYPTDWLFVQYRQGLRTFNNRRGIILDTSRLTTADASTHNFGVVARYRGLTAGLYYFINLEKVDELPNDLLRLSVTYEF